MTVGLESDPNCGTSCCPRPIAHGGFCEPCYRQRLDYAARDPRNQGRCAMMPCGNPRFQRGVCEVHLLSRDAMGSYAPCRVPRCPLPAFNEEGCEFHRQTSNRRPEATGNRGETIQALPLIQCPRCEEQLDHRVLDGDARAVVRCQSCPTTFRVAARPDGYLIEDAQPALAPIPSS